MDFGLRDRVVVVTGAARGIGAALARAYAEQGAHVALLGNEYPQLQEVAAAMTGESLAIDVELTDDRSVAVASARLRERWSAIDVLVNNAGTEFPTPLSDSADDYMSRWDALVRNNVGSMVRLTRALLPAFRRGSSIINQSSIWGLKGVPEFSAYVASKHAVIGLTRSLAWELGSAGIRVNAVCPGWIQTEAALRSLNAMAASSGRDPSHVMQELLADQVTPSFLQPEDIVGAFLFLASDAARAITGQALVVSHGEVMH
jgi:NAD(P)-dependent dehydrogenase (short-subunit alcohol dehydrogenase family)